MTRLPAVLIASLWFLAPVACADVRDSSSERSLSLSENAPALRFPREDWIITSERVRQDRLVVYYLLVSEASNANFSVYINRSGACQAADKCLELSLSNPSYKDARDLERMDVGPFKVAHFYLDKPMGTPIQQTHVLASAVVDGHWFDVHLSSAAKDRPDPAQLLVLLRTFSLR